MSDQAVRDDDRALLLGLGVLFAVEITFLGAILWAVGASFTLAISVIAFSTAILVSTLFIVTRVLWVPWQRRYPAQPIEPDAVTRTWQSFVFGYLGGFNHCLSITADSQYLHLHPMSLFRCFGARRISLPWDRMTSVKRSFAGTMSARIDGRRFAGPDWAMKLAAAER